MDWKLPQKVVPLEAVFIVILFWKCTKSPHPQEGDIVAVVVGLWIVWAGTLFVAVHTIHSLACQCSLFPFRPGTLDIHLTGAVDVPQGWHVANRGVPPVSIIVPHPLIHNRDQLAQTLGFQKQRVSLAFETLIHNRDQLAQTLGFQKQRVSLAFETEILSNVVDRLS